MDRIDGPGSVNGRFSGRNPFLGLKGTTVTPDWLNGVQEELLTAIVASGQTPSRMSTDQLKAAIELLSSYGPSGRAGTNAPNLPQAITPSIELGARAVSRVGSYGQLRICGNTTEPPYTTGHGVGGKPVGTITVSEPGLIAVGASQVNMTGLTDLQPLRGHVFTIAGDAQQYEVEASTFPDGTDTSLVTFSPNLVVAIPGGSNPAVTFNASASVGNTTEPNEYNDGAFAGQLWPYMVSGAAMTHSPGGQPAGDNFYPACHDNQGVNGYAMGPLIPRRTFVHTAEIVMRWSGDLVVGEPNLFLEWVVVPNPNGGWSPSSGFDPADLAIAFQSDSLGATTSGTFPVTVEIIGRAGGRSGNNHAHYWTCNFLIGAKQTLAGGSGCHPPELKSERRVNKVIPQGTLNWRNTDTLLPVLWKFEKDTLLGSPGLYGRDVEAKHDATNLLRINSFSCDFKPDIH